MKKAGLLALLIPLTACTGMPPKVTPITNLDAQRYLGTWYEIARLDHSFERGLSRVTANYSPREDGGIKVVNKGYQAEKNKWNEATGKAYFVGEKNVGHLKVSFFGPFYASYLIFDLDENYQTAYVSGHNTSYLWLLSRQPRISQKEKDRFIETAREKGFDVSQLIWVDQSAFP